MFTDVQLGLALDAMVREIDVPPVPLLEIRRKISQVRAPSRYAARFYVTAIAATAAAVLIAALPSVAPSFVQNVEAHVEAILRWTPPSTLPRSVWSALRSKTRTLTEAQSRVPFTVVPPVGLPSDVVSAQIQTTPTGIYSKKTHSWRVGSPTVTFSYRRADGGSFALLASQFDPQDGPPSKYIFEDKGQAPDGREILVRHDVFVWRNGSQVMEVHSDEGLTVREIESIRASMRGVPIPGVWPPAHSTSNKLYRLNP